MADNDEAQALTRAMIEAGREPFWILLVVGWTFGETGRDAALTTLEQDRGPGPTIDLE